MPPKPTNLINLLMVLMTFGCVACGSGTSTSQKTPTPTITTIPVTSTPTIAPSPTTDMSLGELPVHSILFTSIGASSNVYYSVQGTPDGFVYQLQELSTDPSPFIGKLYYYRYATNHIQLLDTVQQQPVGNDRNIRLTTVAGNYVAYIKSDNSLENWELWLTNLTTDEHILIDSPSQTSEPQYPSNFAFDGQHLVWASLLQQANQVGSIIRVYTVQQRTTKTIFSDFSSPLPFIYRPAVSGSTITYTKIPYGPTDATSETIWRMNLDGSQRQQIATTKTASVNIQMGANYVAWDELNEPSLNTVHVIDLRTNQEINLPYDDCVRPLVFTHYLTCVNIDTKLFLFDLSTGKYGSTTLNASAVSMTSDRVIWTDNTGKNVLWLFYPNP